MGGGEGLKDMQYNKNSKMEDSACFGVEMLIIIDLNLKWSSIPSDFILEEAAHKKCG